MSAIYEPNFILDGSILKCVEYGVDLVNQISIVKVSSLMPEISNHITLELENVMIGCWVVFMAMQ